MNNSNRRGRRITAVLLAAGLLLCCLPLAAGAADVSKAVYPKWFSFSKSCLVIENEKISIGKGYYTDSFGPLKGNLLYDMFENGGHGMCYGLAVANAALLNRTPALDSFVHADKSAVKSISDLQKGTVEQTTSLPLMCLIKYGYVLQANTATAQNFETNRNDAAGLYAAVSDFVYRDGPPVIVGLLGKYNSHEVLAVGLLGREDIVVCDSNDPTQPYVMDFTGGRWSYRCARLSWRSPDDSFDFATNASLLYDNLRAASGGAVIPEDYAYTAPEETEGNAEIRVSGMAPMDADRLLLAFHEDCSGGAEGKLWIGSGGSPLEEDDYLLDYYWTQKDAVAALRNKRRASRSFLLAGSDSGILARIPPGGTGAAMMTEAGPTALVTGDTGDSAAAALLRMNGDAMDCCVADGFLDGGELYAEKTAAGFLVDGLKDLTVRFCRRWEEDSETVECAGGRVLIRGDYDAFTVSLMGDADGDGEVSAADARLVLRCSVALEDIARFDFVLCDFDADGEISSGDARLILRRSVGLRE